jgi:outer membrane protein OmpA-like peptidoglycan-associated protein
VKQSDGKPVDGNVMLVDRQDKGIPLERLAAGDFHLRVSLQAESWYKLKVESSGFEPFYGEYRLKSSSDTSLFEQTIFLTKKPPIALSNLSLFYESNKVVPQNLDVLEMIAAMMRENQGLSIRISGHTDSNGDEKYNEVLSNQRSEQAKKFLVATGISPQRISVAAFGETQPLTTNATPAGRKFNRRTEIEFISN